MEKEPKDPIKKDNAVTEKPVEKKTTDMPQPAPVKPVRKRRVGAKLLFWLLIIIIFGGGFTVLGVYAARTVIPDAENWLESHNFIAQDNPSQYSPLLPQPTDGAKGSNALSIPQVVRAVSPGVVTISVKPAAGQSNAATTIGTGFVIDSSGIIVTNQHVVSDTTATYVVTTQDQKTYTPTSIIRDDVNDIALVIVNAKGLTSLALGDSSKVQVGETVIAIGNPLGEYPGSVTVGVLSGVGRSVTTSDGFWGSQKEYTNVLQTDAAINPGNSGGPLLDMTGNVVGINFATTGGADNISFALPINLVKQKLQEYKQYGKFRTAYLGVGYRMVTQQEASFYNVSMGALVRSITAGSPAASSELKVGDIITKVNGADVNVSLASSLAKYQVGDEITLTALRQNIQGQDQTFTVKIKLVDRPASAQ